MATRIRRGRGWWWRGGGVAAFFLLAMTPRVGVAADGSFPEPEELAPAVRFWAATFTQYRQRDVVIHDRVQLGLVYDVVRDVVSTNDSRVQAAIAVAIERIERSAARGPFALFQ